MDMLASLFALIFTVAFIFILICSCQLVNGKIIDDKIELYQSQNDKLNASFEYTIDQYKEYEGNTFKDLKPSDNIDIALFLSLYPELKTDELVNKQLDLYYENNKQILRLKETKLRLTIYKWWLYFGK